MIASRWTEDAFRSLILGCMVACIALSLVTLAQQQLRDFRGGYLVLFCALTAVEGYFSYRLHQRDLLQLYGGVRSHLLELVVLFLLLQLCVDATYGQAPLQNGVPQVDAETVGLFGPVLISWLVGRGTARLLDWLDRSPDQDPGYLSPSERLIRQFFLGGTLLFVAAGLTQQKVAQLLKIAVPSQSGPLLNVLLYFLLGMILLGHMRYAILRRRWRDQRFEVAAGLGRRWMRYSLVFVGLVALAALLIPTSHAVVLVHAGRAVGETAYTVLTHVWSGLRDPLMRLLSLFTGPFRPSHRLVPVRGIHLPPIHLRGIQTPPKLPPHHAHGGGRGGGGSWLRLLELVLFWAAVLAGLLVVFRMGWKHRPRGSRLELRLGPVLAALGRIWEALRRLLLRPLVAVVEHMPGGSALSRRMSAPGGPLRFLRLDSLSPREQVLYYFRNVVRRAERQGISRRGSQTPSEFGSSLAARLSEARDDMQLLTGAFVEARYSRHEVDEMRAQRARTSWRRVRTALRSARGRPAD